MGIFSFKRNRKPNAMQQAFIDDFSGNQILYAGAGTGKTFSIAKKIEKAIKSEKIQKDEILCLTFTAKGRQEMLDDIASYVENGIDQVFTIHGFCLKLIKEYAKRTNINYADPRILDQMDFDELMRNNIIPDFTEFVANDNLISRTGKPLSEYRKLDPCIIDPMPVWYTDDGFVPYLGPIWERSKFAYYENKQTCPYCNERLILSNGACVRCHRDFIDFVPETLQFSYYNFFTTLRHVRYRQGFYSENQVTDYQQTIDFIKKDEKAYQALMSQPRQKGVDVSQKFASWMELYGASLLDLYLKKLEEENVIDYDSMIFNALRLLESDPSVSEHYRYKMIIVDEMQDTSELEFNVIRHLFKDAHIIFCGDIFQTIYEWRGSDPGYMLSILKNDYHAKEYYFFENYRSTKTLCNASFEYLKNAFPNELNLPERIQINSKMEGERITVLSHDSVPLQAAYLFNEVKKYKDKSVCLMTRTNFSAQSLARSLQAINDLYSPHDQVLFYTSQEEGNFFSDAGIKDAVAFLRILLRPSETLSMERIADRYIKGVGKKTLSLLRENKYVKVTSFLSKDVFEYHDEFASWLDSEAEFVVYDLETTGLDRRKDEFVQIAAIRFDYSGKEIDRMNELVVPSIPISEGALKTHHKSIEEIIQYGTRDLDGVLKKFARFCEGAYLFGHNSTAFDRVILRRQYDEEEIPFPNIKGEGDTLLMAKRLLPNLKNFKLETLCHLLSIVNENAHDAFSDVMATKAVFLALRDQYMIPTRVERVLMTRKFVDKFEKIFDFYTKTKDLIEQNETELFLSKLEEILMTRRDNRESRVFRSRWKRIKQIILERAEFLEADLQHFIEEALYSSNQFSLYFNDENRIPIVTVHQTKGSEFDVVFLFDADDEKFPSMQAMKAGKGEEEKRLFYVAMTRAKEKLCITYCNRIAYDYSAKHSRFIDFIPKDYLSFS